MTLRIYNTLSRKKEDFVPLDPANVRMYVCGPTVYDYAHIGNARPAIVFDVLYRLLRHLYGPDHVTYVRNITDVDDKIIERAKADGVDIDELTRATAAQYHADVAALGCLEPTVEPRATEHISDMIAMIERLIEVGCAYEADGHVLFDVPHWDPYGELSRRSTDEMLAGARVDVAPYKESPMDFVLWKPSAPGQPGWDSPWGRGRPGWHIECSAMSARHLGEVFDIHGGGIDLAFPHHENEIAQSRCAHGTDAMARYWMHNGFLQVEGEKMSKSLGNFITIRELLETEKFGGRKWPGEAIRLAMLQTHYRQPIDWTSKAIEVAIKTLDHWQRSASSEPVDETEVDPRVIEALSDDMNTPLAISQLHLIADEVKSLSGWAGIEKQRTLRASAQLLGLMSVDADGWFFQGARENDIHIGGLSLKELIEARNAAREAKNFAEADRIRDELAEMGVVLKDGPDGTTWELAR